MIGLDSNCLLRYLVRDDEKQYAQIARRIAAAADARDAFYINHIVLCELVWVLTQGYGFAKPDVCATLDILLASGAFQFEQRATVMGALADYKTATVGFADCLIAQKNALAGCDKTLTFDKRAKRIPDFEVMSH